ncbi:MAG TPA: hypothetical protein VMN82_08375 [Thermoanaerobaculia bacterium]|nr:hypothetical protein [Thermoanaerobaculia bacterium]
MQKLFVGHVRFAADGLPEFATGWNETEAPKKRITAEDRPALLTSRGWFDAYSTSSRTEPFAIETCRCGARKQTSPFRPAPKPPSKRASSLLPGPLPPQTTEGEANGTPLAERRVKL